MKRLYLALLIVLGALNPGLVDGAEPDSEKNDIGMKSAEMTDWHGVEGSLPRVIDHSSVDAVDSFPQATRDAIAQQRWFFTHASVGANMLNGLRDLHSQNAAQFPLTVSAVTYNGDDQRAVNPPTSTTPGTVYECSRGNPGWAAKVSIFANSISQGGWHAPGVDLVMNKLCYIDEAADAQTYLDSMAALEAAHPGTTFVYTTMPLTTDSDSNAVLRCEFNDAVRAYCSTHGKLLFDIADIEAHEPDGDPVTFTRNGQTYPRLADVYTSDGGHLNSAGRQRVARGWYAVAAAALRNGNGLARWREQYYSPSEITQGLGTPGGDDDGDGIPTLLEYVFGQHPRQPDGQTALASVGTDGHAALAFDRAPNLSEVELAAQSSADLTTFTTVATLSNGYWAPSLAGAVVTETGTDPISVTITLPGIPTSVFFRLRATTTVE